MKKTFQVYLLALFVLLVWSIYLIAQCADMAIPAWRTTMVASFISTVLLLATFILSALALSIQSAAKLATFRILVSIIALSTMTLGFSLLQVGDKLTILQIPGEISMQNREYGITHLEIRKSGADSSLVRNLSSRLNRIDGKIYCGLDSDWFTQRDTDEQTLTIHFSNSSIPVEYSLQQISDLRKKAFAGYVIILSSDDIISKFTQD